jgi:hypothetical protein
MQQVRCPAVLSAMYYPNFGWIDRGNRVRQDLFALEFDWQCTSWKGAYRRGMEGTNVADAWAALKYFQPRRHARFGDGLLELIDDWLEIPNAAAAISPIAEPPLGDLSYRPARTAAVTPRPRDAQTRPVAGADWVAAPQCWPEGLWREDHEQPLSIATRVQRVQTV